MLSPVNTCSTHLSWNLVANQGLWFKEKHYSVIKKRKKKWDQVVKVNKLVLIALSEFLTGTTRIGCLIRSENVVN